MIAGVCPTDQTEMHVASENENKRASVSFLIAGAAMTVVVCLAATQLTSVRDYFLYTGEYGVDISTNTHS
ncbi:hypothetical protein [Bradyrhizobium liaoningense]|uniref:hypothetical protein n=1 Tax=Bradyrhizobium liaoningense TaxID=43992 RepID=UPI001BA9948D|nr:hypothetical protein [Bradyrhizobium liaoningense]MBR0820234.1 hypothetical protein [Bradyrhizobium liaoningense]